jgi:hypothetical protein
MNLLNYAPFWRGDEGRTARGRFCTRGSKLSGDEIRPTGKAFDVILTGDYGAVSVRDIGNDEHFYK